MIVEGKYVPTSEEREELKASFLEAAEKYDLDNAEENFVLREGKGLIGFKQNGEMFFTKFEGGREVLPAKNAEEMVKDIIEQSPEKRRTPADRREARTSFKKARATHKDGR